MGFNPVILTPQSKNRSVASLRTDIRRKLAENFSTLEFVLCSLVPAGGNRSRRAKLSHMKPGELVLNWVEAFNRGDADALAKMYRPDAVNHQVANEPVEGREAIRRMFADGFAEAEMVCIPENLFEDGEWAILEWRDPKGLRGCGFFHVIDGSIVFQRGYWDRLSFIKLHGLSDV